VRCAKRTLFRASANAAWSNACVHCRFVRGAAETTAVVGACGEDLAMQPRAPGQEWVRAACDWSGSLAGSRSRGGRPCPAPKPASDPRRATAAPASRLHGPPSVHKARETALLSAQRLMTPLLIGAGDQTDCPLSAHLARSPAPLRRSLN
jgi:hypothetical protein